MTTTLPAGWKPIPASLYDLILTGDLESLLWKLKGVNEAEEVRMALYNIRQTILAAAPCQTCNDQGAVGNILTAQPCPDCTPPANAQDAPITVSLDPDPRGISVGVWQGSHCIYNGAHAVPVSAQDDAKDERQAAAEPALTIAAIDEYGPQLHWNKHWMEFGVGAKFYAAPAAGDAQDAERYRWLRDPQTDVALVLDKRTGYVPMDESIPGIGGYHTYEYRSGEDLDAAIDAAIAAQRQGDA